MIRCFEVFLFEEMQSKIEVNMARKKNQQKNNVTNNNKKKITAFEGKKFRLQDIFELISSLVSSCNTLTHNHRISEVTPFQTISVMKKKCL